MSESDERLALPPEEVRRIAFLGTPEAAVPSLRALVDAGYEVALVVSQPDRRRGRGGRRTPSPVKQAALDLGLDATDDLSELDRVDPIELGIVVAYGRIIPSAVLQRIPMVNVHFSLLPRWRGAAPVERAILAGDHETGVSIMALAEGLDTGDVYETEALKIDDDVSSVELTSQLADAGAQLLVNTLERGLRRPDGTLWAEPQNGDVTYAAKLERSENRLSFDMAAVDVQRRVRIGRAWTWFRQTRLGVERTVARTATVESATPGTIVEVSPQAVSVATSDGIIDLTEVKPEGRRAQKVGDWVNGARIEPGERLGIDPSTE